jgi:hypothetical protein
MINVIQLFCAALLGWYDQRHSVVLRSITQLSCAALLGWYDQRHSVVLRSITRLVRSSFSCSAQHYSVGVRSIIRFFASYLVNMFNITWVIFAALLGRYAQHNSVGLRSITRLVFAALLDWDNSNLI